MRDEMTFPDDDPEKPPFFGVSPKGKEVMQGSYLS